MRVVAVLGVMLLAGVGQATAQGLAGASGTRSFEWPNGDSFVGEFRGGLPNGPGTMRYADGERVSGTWIDGCLRIGDRRLAIFTTLKSCPTGMPVPLPQLSTR